MSDIRLTRVKIQNYKSIQNVDFPVYFSNIFFGKNNCGKSSILKAINLALDNDGSISEKDVFTTENSPYSIDKKVVVELLFEPEDIEATKLDPEWEKTLKGLTGNYSGKNREIFGVHKEFVFNAKTKKYDAKVYSIKEFVKHGESVLGDEIPDYIFTLNIVSVYIDATLQDEENYEKISSFVKELLDKLEYLKNVDLSQFSDDVVKEIKRFDPEFAYKSVFDTVTSLTNISSSAWVYIVAKALINLFYKLMKPYHSVILIEEPETHMHPQAQMELMHIIKQIEGQKYICTHSPYIVNHFPIHKLVRVVREGDDTIINKFDSRISSNELKAINLKCMTYKSEMIFANKVILFEGQTEHIALPIFFKKYFGCEPFEKGYSFIYVEGDSNYKAYLQICNALNIDWYIFSDGEPIVIDFLNRMMGGLTHNPNYDVLKDKRISLIPDGLCYEEYLAYFGYAKDVSNVIDKKERRVDTIKHKVKSNSWEIFKKESRKYKPEYPDYEQCLAVMSKKHKIDYAEDVAREICKNHDANNLPKPVLDLFNLIK